MFNICWRHAQTMCVYNVVTKVKFYVYICHGVSPGHNAHFFFFFSNQGIFHKKFVGELGSQNLNIAWFVNSETTLTLDINGGWKLLEMKCPAYWLLFIPFQCFLILKVQHNFHFSAMFIFLDIHACVYDSSLWNFISAYNYHHYQTECWLWILHGYMFYRGARGSVMVEGLC